MKGFKKVETKQDLKNFIRTPAIVQNEDPNFIAQLPFERAEHLGKKNPYFKHARHQYFIAYENNEPIGRISAQIDDLAQNRTNKVTGHFGLIEADSPQTLKNLLSISENWLAEHGATEVQGPFSLSINDETGLLIDGFETPPYMMMNHAPIWYTDVLENTGYTKAKDLFAYHVDIKNDLPRSLLYMATQAEKDQKLTERPINMKNFEEELGTILEIFNNAWENNWGFVPMTDEEISYTAENMKLLIKPELARIAFYENKPIAMIVALPNLNEALQGLHGSLLPFGWAKLLWRLKIKGLKTGRVLLMGVRKEFQGSPIGAAVSGLLMKNLHEAARKANMNALEMSWILEDNEPMKRLIEASGGKPYKRYRVFQKTLPKTKGQSQ